MKRMQAIAAAIFIVAAVGGIGFVLTNSLASSSTTENGNLLKNGGFETGNLQGWQNGGLLAPSVQSTTVRNGTFAARFETTSNGNALSQCTLHALECGLLNSSTISQTVPSLSLSPNSTLAIALYPMFQDLSIFQMTLDFSGSQQNSQDVTIYYIVSASSGQCNTYSQLLVNASHYARAFCLSAQEGQWTVITRNVLSDIPSAISPSYVNGSSVTLSLSFAGGNSTDTAYVDLVYLR